MNGRRNTSIIFKFLSRLYIIPLFRCIQITISLSDNDMTTVIESCPISPPPESAAELTVPLSFFDMVWLHFHPVRRLLFYDYPCSQHHFRDTVVPKLKQSLSLTLEHFLPVAANLLYPLDTQNGKPFLRYVAGDSVSLTIAESNADFEDLVGNHARNADQFYDFVPKMPEIREESEFKLVPVMALQLTHFPGRGICVGFSNHHTLGDGSSISRFMLAWASISKFGGDEEFLAAKPDSLPIFDRSVLQDINGTNANYWKAFERIPFNESLVSSFPVPTNRVRATFILRRTDIENLRDLVLAKRGLAYVSSFVVTVSYVWTCLLKSLGETEDGQPELLLVPADARGRLNAMINPPIPANYFGNCLGGALTIMEHSKLVGEGGFVIAAEAVAEEIKTKVNNKEEFLKGMDDLPSFMGKMMGCRAIGISGSPKFDLPDADFGWGKARKMEVVSMDGEKCAMSLCKARDFEGGLEIGLSLGEDQMKAFAAAFADGLMSRKR